MNPNVNDAFQNVFRAEDGADSAASQAAGPGGADPLTGEAPEPKEAAAEDEKEEPAVSEDRGQKQSDAENARYAAARRKAERERDRSVAAAKAEAAAEIDRVFAESGMVNPYTGAAIRSRADFEAWQRDFAAAEGGDELSQKAAAIEEERHRLDDTVRRELAAIRQWDPEVGSLEDIAASDAFDEIYAKVARGYTLSDAYYLANGERLRRRDAELAERAASNRARSKEHLTATTSRGSGGVTVPKDVMDEFHRLLPHAGDDEIRRFYQRDQRAAAKRRS
ncbi:MAG: hypothetical protein ACOX8R_05175 [Bacillota bacterium]|jgi:hypothetical protein